MLTTDRIEIVPVPGIVEQVRRHLPAGSAVSVTALPSHSIRETIDVALQLAAAGYDAVPHLAAARMHSARDLESVLSRLSDSSVAQVFVVGGDGPAAGVFADGTALLREVRDQAGERFRLGVAAYPEGHPAFDVRAGREILRRKALEADYAVTQMCFDGAVLGRFVRQAVADGIRLPFWLGVPGRVGVTRLLRIAARIGVGPSLAFARKGSNLRLLGGFDSTSLRRDTLAHLGTAAPAIAGFHVYSFNALDRIDPRAGVDARVRVAVDRSVS